MYPIEIGSNISKIKDTFHMQKNKLFKYDLSHYHITHKIKYVSFLILKVWEKWKSSHPLLDIFLHESTFLLF